MATVEPIRKLRDIKKVEKILETQSLRNLLLFTLGINCGLRISDILALDVQDVKNRSHIQIREKKTGKYKLFPINSKLKPMLQEFTRNKMPEEPLFTSTFNNTRLDCSTVYRIINFACKKAGVKGNIGTHSMRKTFGYHHYRMFKDAVILQKIFNHSSLQVTLRYIGIEQDALNRSYIKFIL